MGAGYHLIDRFGGVRNPATLGSLMKAKQFILISYTFMGLYLFLAAVFSLARDREHTFMFLTGAALWIVAAFIWNRVHRQGE